MFDCCFTSSKHYFIFIYDVGKFKHADTRMGIWAKA